MTTTHVDFDSTKPAGTSNPTTYSADNLSNLRALRDLIIAGFVPGFIQSRTNGTGTANQPQYVTWYNSTLGIGFRWNITWTATTPTTVQEEWTNDSGVAWISVNSAQVNTFDASQNLTASTNSGGFVNILLEVWGKCLKAVSDLAFHRTSSAGDADHALGTAAHANLNAMTISGGSVDATPIGGTTRAAGSFTRVAEALNTYTPGASAGVSVDWGSAGSSKITRNGTNAITFANIPTGTAGHVVDVDNLNGVTWPASVDWGVGGVPSIAGRALVTLTTNDAGTKVFASISWRAV